MGYPLCSYSVFGNLGTTEARVGSEIGNVADLAALGASVTARLVGSINDFSGAATTFRLRAATSGGADFLTAPLMGTWPVVHGNGLFSVAFTFTPPAGPHMYLLTQQTDAGSGTVNEVVLILEVDA
jgi:hypothetical protein